MPVYRVSLVKNIISPKAPPLLAGNIRLVWRGEQLSEQVRQVACAALLDQAEFLLEEANRIVPFDVGTLMQSGETSVDPPTLEAAVSYDTAYAQRLHEHPQYHFQPPGQGKWLESTFLANAEGVKTRIADAIRGALSGP